jgi:hypothetical protein
LRISLQAMTLHWQMIITDTNSERFSRK